MQQQYHGHSSSRHTHPLLDGEDDDGGGMTMVARATLGTGGGDSARPMMAETDLQG